MRAFYSCSSLGIGILLSYTDVLYEVDTGKQLEERKTPFDNRFTVLTEGAIFNHTSARTWEVLNPRTLAVLEEVRDAELMKDTGTIYRRLFAQYARDLP